MGQRDPYGTKGILMYATSVSLWDKMDPYLWDKGILMRQKGSLFMGQRDPIYGRTKGSLWDKRDPIYGRTKGSLWDIGDLMGQRNPYATKRS